jgi:hypothetical protein
MVHTCYVQAILIHTTNGFQHTLVGLNGFGL